LRTAKSYLYILTSVIYYVQVITIKILLLLTYFLNKHKQYLINRLYSLISKMLNLLTYSKAIGLNTSNIGQT
ncbi:hypothetical protein EV356DRAFT_457974, partial [Viridothelium virens]